MEFGLFGSAQAKRGGPDVDSGVGFREFVDYNVEAESLGFRSTFLVEHHFTGFGQISATLNLLTFIAARTKTLRLGTAVLVLPWHNPVLLAEQTATLDLLSDPEIEGWRAEAGSLRARLSDLVSGSASEGSQEDLAGEVGRLSLERDRVERRIRSKLAKEMGLGRARSGKRSRTS